MWLSECQNIIVLTDERETRKLRQSEDILTLAIQVPIYIVYLWQINIWTLTFEKIFIQLLSEVYSLMGVKHGFWSKTKIGWIKQRCVDVEKNDKLDREEEQWEGIGRSTRKQTPNEVDWIQQNRTYWSNYDTQRLHKYHVRRKKEDIKSDFGWDLNSRPSAYQTSAIVNRWASKSVTLEIR